MYIGNKRHAMVYFLDGRYGFLRTIIVTSDFGTFNLILDQWPLTINQQATFLWHI